MEDETATLPNSQQLRDAILDVLAAGANISFTTDTGTGVTTISGEAGGGGFDAARHERHRHQPR